MRSNHQIIELFPSHVPYKYISRVPVQKADSNSDLQDTDHLSRSFWGNPKEGKEALTITNTRYGPTPSQINMTPHFKSLITLASNTWNINPVFNKSFTRHFKSNKNHSTVCVALNAPKIAYHSNDCGKDFSVYNEVDGYLENDVIYKLNVPCKLYIINGNI